MAVSVFELFSIGIGPSSSHTVGPMRAAKTFISTLRPNLDSVSRVFIELYGSLALTGHGHGTDKALLLGLEGHTPEGVDPEKIAYYLDRIEKEKTINLLGIREILFDMQADLIFHKGQFLPYHSNAMRCTAVYQDGSKKVSIYYSIGGGFILPHEEIHQEKVTEHRAVPFPFNSARELLALCHEQGKQIYELMMENEKVHKDEEDIREDLLQIWRVMQASVSRGCQIEGILPGGIGVKRRAPDLYRSLLSRSQSIAEDPTLILEWTSLFALAVNEENAAGGRVVTAPTNGAAGVLPAVLHYIKTFVPQYSDDSVVVFFLTAAAICNLYKQNASISAAEVGCQGEIGVASSIAAAGLCAVLGGSVEQIENAAEIAMEHHLGLTCDPIGGFVQIPCIERNAMGSLTAINAARLAMAGDGTHRVSLDQVITTMYQTGKDMHQKYKETSQGGLALYSATQSEPIISSPC